VADGVGEGAVGWGAGTAACPGVLAGGAGETEDDARAGAAVWVARAVGLAAVDAEAAGGVAGSLPAPYM
jgi:hypothetical protein